MKPKNIALAFIAATVLLILMYMIAVAPDEEVKSLNYNSDSPYPMSPP